MDKPLVRVGVEKWQGQISASSPHFLTPGAAQSQVNARCQVPGQLDVRPGMVPVNFANAAAQGSYGVMAMAYYNCPQADYLVYQTLDGSIKAGSNPVPV